MKRVILFLFSLTIVTQTFGQKTQYKIDSLQSELKNKAENTSRVGILKDLGSLYLEINLNASREYYSRAISLLLANNSEFSELEHAFLLDCLGVVERRASNYEKAFEYYLSALKLKEEVKDSITLGRSYHNIALLFNRQSEYEKAKLYMEKALPLRKEHSDSVSYANTLNAYGIILHNLNRSDSSMYYLAKAESYFGNHPKVAYVYSQLASMALDEGEYEDAISIYLKNRSIFKENNLNEKLLHTEISLSKAYQKIGNMGKALSHIKDAEVLAKKTNNTKYLQRVYQRYSEIYGQLGDFERAYENSILFKNYTDSTFNNERTNAITSLELNYNYEKQKLSDSLEFAAEKKILKANTKKAQTQKWLFASIFGLIALGLYISLSKFKYKLKEEHLEKEVLSEKMNVLKHQIEHLSTDNLMRVQFKKELLEKIHRLREQKEERSAKELHDLTAEIQAQISTESRLDALSNTQKSSDYAFNAKPFQKFPQLTKSEREICHLINMNLSIKEISNIRNTSIGSIKTARYRIRKKLGVEKGMELELFLQNLFEAQRSEMKI